MDASDSTGESADGPTKGILWLPPQTWHDDKALQVALFQALEISDRQSITLESLRNWVKGGSGR
jgi:hypothetical protein